MADYCSTSDVEERLGRDLTASEITQFPVFLQDATVLQINPALGRSYADAIPMPTVINSVAANILVRTYRQNAVNPLGVDVQVGPFRVGGVMKMLPSEEAALRNFAGNGVTSIETISSQGSRRFADRLGVWR